MRSIKTILLCGVFLSAMLLAESCNKSKPAEGKQSKVSVIASLFPLYDFARQVGQDKVEVAMLLSPGTEAHSFEIRPADIIKINKADIFIYTGKFMEPWVEDIIRGVTNKSLLVVNTSENIKLMQESEEHAHDGRDPHIWMDFSNAQKMVDSICEALIQKDPANKDFYLKNAAEYNSELAQLDIEYQATLARCKLNTVIYGGHLAFGYMAKRYNLTFISAYKGFTPDSEPTPKNIVELIEKVKGLNEKYIYTEELISPKVAETLAAETGTKLLPLYAAHNISKDAFSLGETFISIMKKNLENLKTGLQCQ